ADIAPVCQHQPAPRCVDRTWALVDLDADQKLSLAEVRSIHESVSTWLLSNGDELKPRERTNVTLGLALVNMVGLDRLFASYDADSDGQLTREELLADVDLDQRPLPDIVQDREAVKWQQLARRLGAAKPLL